MRKLELYMHIIKLNRILYWLVKDYTADFC
jgi:hypothetical protein